MEPGEIIQEKIEPKKEPVNKMREIIIATDGNSINLVKAEVAGNIELVAVLEALVSRLKIK